MAEIRVTWRRTWQVKPYETETIELGMTDTLTLTGKTATERGRQVGAAEKVLLDQLTEVGDRIMAERLGNGRPD